MPREGGPPPANGYATAVLVAAVVSLVIATALAMMVRRPVPGEDDE